MFDQCNIIGNEKHCELEQDKLEDEDGKEGNQSPMTRSFCLALVLL